MKWAESSIRTGIAKVERELSGLHLNRYRVRRWRSEIDGSPRLDSEHPQSQNFSSHQQKRRPDHSLGAAGKGFDLVSRARAGKLPDKQSQQNLRSQEGDSSLSHCL